MKSLWLAVIAISGACAATKRSPEAYRNDTRKVLDTRTGKIAVCYDQILSKEERVGGTVTIDFVVEKKTGKFTSAKVVPASSGAPEPIVTCILDAMKGLALEPPDGNEGHATFVFDLHPASSS